MAENTAIEWARSTFNHVRGCQHAQADADGESGETAPECDRCYAAAMAKRNPKVLGQWGAEGTRVVAAEPYWRLPFKWDRMAAEIERLVAMPETREKLAAQGFEPFYNGPEQITAILKDEVAKFAKIIKDANIKVQ